MEPRLTSSTCNDKHALPKQIRIGGGTSPSSLRLTRQQSLGQSPHLRFSPLSTCHGICFNRSRQNLHPHPQGRRQTTRRRPTPPLARHLRPRLTTTCPTLPCHARGCHPTAALLLHPGGLFPTAWCHWRLPRGLAKPPGARRSPPTHPWAATTRWSWANGGPHHGRPCRCLRHHLAPWQLPYHVACLAHLCLALQRCRWAGKRQR